MLYVGSVNYKIDDAVSTTAISDVDKLEHSSRPTSCHRLRRSAGCWEENDILLWLFPNHSCNREIVVLMMKSVHPWLWGVQVQWENMSCRGTAKSCCSTLVTEGNFKSPSKGLDLTLWSRLYLKIRNHYLLAYIDLADLWPICAVAIEEFRIFDTE